VPGNQQHERLHSSEPYGLGVQALFGA
jgi:hypothetical protein